MKTHVIKTPLPDLVVLTIDYFLDERGFFIESWHKRDFADAGLDLEFVQEGHSRSKYGVLRGLHYQDMTAPMGKLVRCTVGAIFDVVVDLRVTSRTFGKWFGTELTAENKKQLYLPIGFAHGFATLSDVAEVQYKQTGFYTPSSEGTLLWNDPEVGVEWPIKDPILSKRDQNGMRLKEYLTNPAFK
ncbi:MAG: dTDP-4-dehydrorhamnose 3,5-epimerase [Nitrospirae bacterium RBG_13_41_22]|nr:MAG: dTDP-4-dehydrorhamnose 3,5-epimerase [Nitrospirae bacterium RBG_13_41_22]